MHEIKRFTQKAAYFIIGFLLRPIPHPVRIKQRVKLKIKFLPPGKVLKLLFFRNVGYRFHERFLYLNSAKIKYARFYATSHLQKSEFTSLADEGGTKPEASDFQGVSIKFFIFRGSKNV